MSKTDIANRLMNEHGSIPIEVYLLIKIQSGPWFVTRQLDDWSTARDWERVKSLRAVNIDRVHIFLPASPLGTQRKDQENPEKASLME